MPSRLEFALNVSRTPVARRKRTVPGRTAESCADCVASPFVWSVPLSSSVVHAPVSSWNETDSIAIFIQLLSGQ